MENAIFARELSPASQKILRVLGVTMILYSVALLISMAGMEILSSLNAALALAVLIIESRRDPGLFKRILLPVDRALLGLFIVVVIGALVKTPEGISKIDVIGACRWAPLFILTRTGLAMIWSEKVVRKVILSLMVLTAIISVYSIWQYFNGWDLIRGARNEIKPFGYNNGRPFYRAEGMFGSPMTFGYSMVMSWCFPLALLLFRAEKGWREWYVGAVMALGAGALIATLTRGVWLAAAGALLYLTYHSLKRGTVVVVALIIVMSALATSLFPEFGDRIHKFANTQESSNGQRLDLWKANLQMIKENPLLGVGYGVNEEILPEYYPKVGVAANAFKGHAHNTYLQILSGTGIFGGIFFAIFVVYFLVITWRLHQMAKPGWERGLIEAALAAQIALHIGGLTECNFKDAEVNHQFMFILAIVAARYFQAPVRPTLVSPAKA